MSYALDTDIDLSGHSWTPIGSSSKHFLGTFDGGKYSTSGLNIENGGSYSGLSALLAQEARLKIYRLAAV